MLTMRPVPLPYRPATHGPVQEEEEEPVVDPYLPAAQGVQNDVEAVLLYSPAAQGVQDVAPAREYWPGIHTVQVVAPEVDEYCPAPQFTQGASGHTAITGS